MPNTRATLGVHGLPNGVEFYEATLKWQLSFDISANEVHELGLREVDRVYSEIVRVRSNACLTLFDHRFQYFILGNSNIIVRALESSLSSPSSRICKFNAIM